MSENYKKQFTDFLCEYDWLTIVPIEFLIANAATLAPMLTAIAKAQLAQREIDVSTLEEWEDLAEQFRKATGYLRPGKDVSGAYNETDEMRDERYAAWDLWIAAKRAKAQTAPEVI